MDRANGAGLSPAASRAERFEDEKRRIFESCFSKTEDDGSRKSTGDRRRERGFLRDDDGRTGRR